MEIDKSPTIFDLVAEDESLPQPSERQKKRPSPSSSDSEEEAPASKKPPTVFDLVVVDEALELDSSMPQPSKRQKKRPSPSSSDSEAPASKRRTRQAIVNDDVAKKPKAPKFNPNKPAYFDDLLGAARIKELDDKFQADKQARHDFAYTQGLAIWNKLMDMERSMDALVANVALTSFEIPSLSEAKTSYYFDLHKTYMALVGILSEFFRTNLAALESRVLFVAVKRRLDFVAVWAQCRLAFPPADDPKRSWLRKEFYDAIDKMVTGFSVSTFCKGLIPMLQAHLKWQDNPEVEKAINDIDGRIRSWATYYLNATWSASSHECKKKYFKHVQARKAKNAVCEFIMRLFGAEELFYRDYHPNFTKPEPTFKIWTHLRWRNE